MESPTSNHSEIIKLERTVRQLKNENASLKEQLRTVEHANRQLAKRLYE